MPETTYDLMDPNKRAPGVCPAYMWIGQSFKFCDRCGKPYWEHSHDHRLPTGEGPFSGGRRERHIVITRKQAAKTARTKARSAGSSTVQRIPLQSCGER